MFFLVFEKHFDLQRSCFWPSALISRKLNEYQLTLEHRLCSENAGFDLLTL